jgi:hypothetical protein
LWTGKRHPQKAALKGGGDRFAAMRTSAHEHAAVHGAMGDREQLKHRGVIRIGQTFPAEPHLQTSLAGDRAHIQRGAAPLKIGQAQKPAQCFLFKSPSAFLPADQRQRRDLPRSKLDRMYHRNRCVMHHKDS